MGEGISQVLLTRLFRCKTICGVSRKVAVCDKPYMSSRRNGGDGQEVRRETLTGEEVLQRAGEVSSNRTRPARAKTEVVFILVPVRVSCVMPREACSVAGDAGFLTVTDPTRSIKRASDFEYILFHISPNLTYLPLTHPARSLAHSLHFRVTSHQLVVVR